MAKKKISSFDIGEELKSKLHKRKLKTVEDVLSQSYLQLMTTLNLSSTETQELIHILSISSLPKMCIAEDLLEKEFHSWVYFGDSKLDHILHGCLKQGTLIEFTGPSGVGKTQMCLHLSLMCLKVRSDQNGVCYIDTEGSFRSERLIELLQHQKCENIGEIISRFHIFQPKTVLSLTEILSTLEIFCIENDIRMVILDSVASLARKEFSKNALFERSSALASWSAHIKTLAENLDIVGVVTNQVTTNQTSETQVTYEDKTGSGDKEKTHFIGPALGKMWAHFVNTRFILQFSEAGKRQFIVAKSPTCPVVVKNYLINSSGIHFEEEMTYTFSGMDPSNHRIKTQIPL